MSRPQKSDRNVIGRKTTETKKQSLELFNRKWKDFQVEALFARGGAVAVSSGAICMTDVTQLASQS